MHTSISLYMEDMFVNEEEKIEGEKVVPLCLSRGNTFQEDKGSVSSTSVSKTDFGEVIQGISDGKQSSDTHKCVQKPCLLYQYDYEITRWNHTPYCNLKKNPLQHFCNLTKFGEYSSPGVIYRAESPFYVPVNPRSYKLFVDHLNHHRRRRSTNDLANFVLGYTSTTGPENAVVDSFEQLIFDTFEGNVKVRNLLKGSLFFRLGDPDGNINLGRSRSFNIRETKASEMTSSLADLCNPAPEKPEAEIIPIGQQRCGSDNTFFSCSSLNSARSYKSAASAQSNVSKGLLHCAWRSGIPYFIFSVDDNLGEIYMANPRKVEYSDDKALDYMYLFHSWRDSRKESSSDNNTLDLIAKMRVSSSLTFNSKRSKLTETEFVLFGSTEDHCKEPQSSTSTLKKSKGMSKKMVDIFKTNHLSKHKYDSKFGELSMEFQEFLQEKCIDRLNKLYESDLANLLENHLQPNLELAAIVVKDNQRDSNKERAIGGWGLNFLQNTKIDLADTSLESSVSSEGCQKSCLRERNRSVMSRSMDVLVPAGYHGGPMTKTGGPSTLTERWRSGGHCDCGGWDIGCPLTVLKDRPMNPKVLPLESVQEDCQSVDLFIEDSKQTEPSLKMVNLHEGLYFVYFRSDLSPLQSFSIAVATIHTRTPALSPNL